MGRSEGRGLLLAAGADCNFERVPLKTVVNMLVLDADGAGCSFRCYDAHDPIEDGTVA